MRAALDGLLHDARHGVRTSLKGPGLTLTIVATLAIGIGATSAFFSVVSAVLLRPLPYPEPDRLVLVWSPQPKRGGARGAVSYPDFLDYRQQSTSFEGLAALRPAGATLITPSGAERLEGARVSGGFFDLLRVRPALGRAFGREDDRPGGPKVVVLTDALWRSRFGADPSLVGREVILDHAPFTVLGVLPRDFKFPYQIGDALLFTPLSVLEDEESRKERGMHYLAVLGRLRPGADVAQARSELATLGDALARQYPDSNAGRTATARPLYDEVVGESRSGLLVLMGAVACVLLVACANVANLLLARATGRERELAVRSALGADRARLRRQLLTESLLLGLAGGLAGLMLAQGGVAGLVALAPSDLPRLDEIALDGRVVVFTLIVSLLTGVLFGVGPAHRATRTDPARALNEGGRGLGNAGSPGRQRLRHALIVVEVALSLVLVTGAGLLLRSLGQVQRVDPGFRPDELSAASLMLPDTRYAKPEQMAPFYRELLSRLAARPGVRVAAAAAPLPFSGNIWVTGIFDAGRPEPPPGERLHAHYRAVTGGYFAALGLPIRRGRALQEDDERGRPRAVVLSESLAARLFPAQDPLGQRVRFGVGIDEADEKADWEIVGLAADVAPDRLDKEPQPTFYVSAWQQPWNWMTVVVRSPLPPGTLSALIRDEVRGLDPEVPVFHQSTMRQLVAATVAQRRFQSLLLTAFAAVGLTLAAVGLYGVMAYSVSLQTREIGIRMALGAERRQVLGRVLGQGVSLAGLGVGIGLVSALAVARLVAGLLYGVGPNDPPTFGTAALVLLATAFLASYLPARRATRVDPMVALRSE